MCDYKGVDTLVMELLKSEASKVTVYHIGERPRYLPDKYKTKVSGWKLIGGFETDEARDMAAIESCSHYLAVDFNSDEQRKSGTLKNIYFKHGKIVNFQKFENSELMFCQAVLERSYLNTG